MSKSVSLYKMPNSMEPLFPLDKSKELVGLANDVISESAKLSGIINSMTRRAISDFLKPMNSYYSNRIEGHDTHPIDIVRALSDDYSEDKNKRNLQIEALAHINIFKKLEKELRLEPSNFNITSVAYLKSIHNGFYSFLPDSFLNIKSVSGEESVVIPGELRTSEVKIGRHFGPFSGSLSQFMDRFSTFYDFINNDSVLLTKRIIGIAASHHRLVWIHPFVDGNGRVARLFSDVSFLKTNIDADGLWSISRGLARNIDTYRTKLANADLKRMNDYDGRGNLSNNYLEEFCKFFLEVALDQIKYMYSVLNIDSMLGRIESFTAYMVNKKLLKPEAKYILEDIFLKGKISKADAIRITNTSDKTLKLTIDELVKMGLLEIKKEGVKIMYFVKYSVKYAPLLFPGLYPTIKEVDMLDDI